MYRFQFVTHKTYLSDQTTFSIPLIDGYTDLTAEVSLRHHNTITELHFGACSWGGGAVGTT
jgi:hypothetical protein